MPQGVCVCVCACARVCVFQALRVLVVAQLFPLVPAGRLRLIGVVYEPWWLASFGRVRFLLVLVGCPWLIGVGFEPWCHASICGVCWLWAPWVA